MTASLSPHSQPCKNYWMDEKFRETFASREKVAQDQNQVVFSPPVTLCFSFLDMQTTCCTLHCNVWHRCKTFASQVTVDVDCLICCMGHRPGWCRRKAQEGGSAPRPNGAINQMYNCLFSCEITKRMKSSSSCCVSARFLPQVGCNESIALRQMRRRISRARKTGTSITNGAFLFFFILPEE